SLEGRGLRPHERATPCGWPGGIERPPRTHEMALAIRNAAAAASPPTSAVCRALRCGLAPVKRPLTKPNISRADRVTATEKGSAAGALAENMYGARGMNPPPM